jgi:hypothetical protein
VALSLIHYWGAQAIVERAGLKTANRLPEFILRYRIPAYKRTNPKMPCNLIFYSNESLMSRWDIDRASQYYEHSKGELAAKRETKLAKRRSSHKGINVRVAPAKPQSNSMV